MGLETYYRKRDFKETPEPRGKVARRKAGRRLFVIQKHDATRLHYDFRLEIGGVLKSWAVPKGPSLDPKEKRLAMETEDHPMEYRTFEGTIPEGHYGAGPVIVWDEGMFEPADAQGEEDENAALEAAYRKGHLRFVLHGKKVRGEFHLLRLKGREKGAWLLFKSRDEHVSTEDVTQLVDSVRSKRRLPRDAGVPKGKAARKTASAEAAAGGEAATLSSPSRSRGRWGRGRSLPDAKGTGLVTPMLARLVDKPFSREGWIFEVKWDGYRAVADVRKGKVRLYSRNHKSFDARYQPLADALSRLKHDAIIDGEIVAVDAEGRSSFQLLQNYQKTGQGTLLYYAFDLLELDGRDLRELPLIERKKLLKRIIPKQGSLRYSEHVADSGEALFAEIEKRGFEGIIAKDGGSPYQEGVRTDAWLKIKTGLRQEAVIGGFTEPQGSRRHFGSLILGVYDGDELVPVGGVGTGFGGKTLETLARRLKPLVTKKCPFSTVPFSRTKATWVRPELVAEVKFQEWTEDGIMRQPAFEGLREDKPARDVRREKATPTEAATEEREARRSRPKAKARPARTARPAKGSDTAEIVDIDGKPVRISNRAKIYWPDEGITKGEVIDYYRRLHEVILPYLVDRPQSLLRHPDGITGEAFFQKDIGRFAPAWAETLTLKSSSTGERIRYLLCQDEATLTFMANLGCIGIHPWSSRRGQLDYPDFTVIDLDPEGVGFDKVVEAAQAVRKLFDALGIESYPKTSGATGLHIYVPLGAEYTYDDSVRFAELVARVVNIGLPGTTSVLRSPSKRPNRVYLDYLQNRRGQTLAAPYSLRPRPGATVSTPLKWSEVRRGLDPASFTMKTIFRRLDKLGDLFEGVLGKGNDLRTALEKLERHAPKTAA